MSEVKPYYSNKNITLYKGDCLTILTELSSDGPFADMVFTDPPYGHNNNDNDLINRRESVFDKKRMSSRDVKSASRPIMSDGKEAIGIFHHALYLMKDAIRNECCFCCCCCGGGGPDPQFARWSLLVDSVFTFQQQVIWDKGKIGLGIKYRRSTECILVASKGKKMRWFDTSHRVENIIRPGDYGIKKIIPKATDHPTPKPPELAAHFMRLHSRPGETVLDPFAGGGSTGVAAIREGRKAILIEKDPKYCDLIVRNIENEFKGDNQ